MVSEGCFKKSIVGKIPCEWEILKLKDAVDMLTDGSHFSPKEVRESKYYIATVKNMGQFEINLNSCKKISEYDYNRLTEANCKPENGDVLFSKDGTMGLCFVYTQQEPIVLLSSIAIIRPDNKLDPYFLKYYISNTKMREFIVSNHSSGSALPRLTLTNLKEIPIIRPKIQEQKAIAKILSDLDAKIKLNQKMNETLESIAQAIFKHWFIDFEFPNEEGKPYKSSGGEMVDSELGKVPKKWAIKTLDGIANFLNGLALQRYPAITENDYLPVIKIKEMNYGISGSSDKASRDIPSEYIVHNGDVLFAWSGSLGVTIWCNGEGALNQHIFKISSNEYPKWFYYEWLLYYLPNFIEIARDKATTMGHIQRHHLSESLVAVPDSNTLEIMNNVLKLIIDRIINLKVENDTLTKTRDLFLPSLISGKIRVPLEG